MRILIWGRKAKQQKQIRLPLQVENIKGEKLLVMSSQAYQSLTEKQITDLSQFNRLIHSDISTIETNGGGSARCMIAEVFLPVR